MKIYISSSFKNIHAVKLLRNNLIDLGHEVLDFTKFAPPLTKDMNIEERKIAINADARGAIFDFCTNSCSQSDLVVYIGESGQDSACEVAIAWTSGVPTYGLLGTYEKPGTILNRMVTKWFDDADKLIEGIQKLQKEIL